MNKRVQLLVCVFTVFCFAALAFGQLGLSPIEELGKNLFFDTNLSTPPGMSCATCHAPEVGFTGPISDINDATAIYPGVIHTRFGNRKPPAAAYAGDSPVLYYDAADEVWVGGMFWDGRATGNILGDPLAEQAQGPFLNPLEMNNPDAMFVCREVAFSNYAELYQNVWGEPAKFTKADVAMTYERIARSIAAYERSMEVNPFTSKYDYYLTGQATLTPQEAAGLNLFNGDAMCAGCHISEVGPNGEPPLFTDFTYDNLGVPRNPDNPFYLMPRKYNPLGDEWTDYGLGGYLQSAGYAEEVYMTEMGKQKVPTLRNVDLRPDPSFVKAYAHNGYFKSLEEIVHFYNTRDVETWPAPEVAENVNTDELGNLGLTATEEANLVAFLKTLSDGYVLESKQNIAVQGAVLAPASYSLSQNYPNPFNPSTTISFELKKPGMVTLKIFNLLGEEMATLVSGELASGTHEYRWDASDVPSGMYLYRLESEGFTEVRKMILMR